MMNSGALLENNLSQLYGEFLRKKNTKATTNFI